jgi:DNA-binding Lrp family transcriptional regulator
MVYTKYIYLRKTIQLIVKNVIALLKGKIDNLDLKIIDLLSQDPRSSVKSLAKRMHVSRLTISKRLKKLEESGLIAYNVGLNLRKLGFRTAYLGFEIKSMAKRRELLDILTKCPRVLTILQPSDEINMTVYCYGENTKTLEAFIESLRDHYIERIDYVHYSEPPVYPENICIKAYPEKSDVAPCGLKCEECYNYKDGTCLGCPAVKAYRGFL